MADETIYISEIIKHLKDKGYSNAAISGILGNIDVETGGTFDFQQEEIGKGKGYGLFQFDFMKSYYDDWLNKNKKNDSIQSQVDFMDDVIQGKKFIDTKDGKIEMLKPSDRVELQTFLKESNDPEEITLEFGKIFENPKQGKEHYDRRVDSALSFSTTFDQELAPPTDSQKGEITSVLESLNPRKPGGGRVSMYKGGDPDQPGANFNQLLELAIRLENARTFAGTKVADASTEMEQSPDSFLRSGETLEDWDTTFRKPNAAGGRIYGKYAQQIADGGRVGMLGERTGYFTGALADTRRGKAMSPGTRADYEPGPGHRETRGGPPGTDQVTPNYVPTQTPVTTGGASPFPYTRLAGDIPKYIKSPGPVTTEGSSPFPYTRQVGDIPDYTAFADTQGIDESKTARELKREDRRALAEKIRRYLKFPPAYDEKGNPIPTFSKTGPQQMEGLPEGITSDKEYINIVMNLDIPITEKWSLLGNIGYGKFRDKIEYGDDELFLQEGGGKSRKVGIGYNQGDEDGLSGSFMYNPDTGGYNVGFTKQVDFNKWLMGKADGGIAGIMNKFS